MQNITLSVQVGPNGYMPTFAHPGDAGMDLRASEDIVIPGAVSNDYRVEQKLMELVSSDEVPTEEDLTKFLNANSVSWSVVSTDVYFHVPEGYFVGIYSKSGLAAKHGLFVTNAPGVIDTNYRGEIKVIMANLGKDYQLNKGDKVAQAILRRKVVHNMLQVDTISQDTSRGSDGLGSTGK